MIVEFNDIDYHSIAVPFATGVSTGAARQLSLFATLRALPAVRRLGRGVLRLRVFLPSERLKAATSLLRPASSEHVGQTDSYSQGL